MAKKPYKGLTKSRKNTSGRASAAKREAAKTKERMKDGKAVVHKSSRPGKERLAKGMPYRLKRMEAMPVRQLPETAASKKGMSLRQLIRATPKLFINNAVDVEAKKVTKLKTKTLRPCIKGAMVTYDLWRKDRVRRVHETYIIGMDEDLSKPVNRHRKVLVQCSCLTGDTKVLTDKGWQTIFEIAQPHTPDYFPLKYNIKGELFAGSAPFYTGMKSVYTLQFSNGQSITATKDHKFLKHVPLGNRKVREDWVELRDLQVGDCLLTNAFDPGKVERTEEYWEAFFIGVMQGDGTVFASGRMNLKLYGDKDVILNRLIKNGLVKDIAPVKGRDAINVQLTHRAIELGARYQFENKKSVKLDSLTKTMGYLSGLVATDGTTYANGDILLRGAKEYLEQLQWKLMEYGYTQTTFYRERAAGVGVNVVGGKRLTSKKELWALRISNQCNILPNVALSKYHRERIERVVVKPRKPWVKIQSITYAAKQHVYDITVPGPHRFAANGVIAHNCENFVYVFEYANASVGASRLIYSNGEPPNFTNPRLAPGCCKHIIALAKVAIEKDV
jgi:hypothetical protein